MERLQKFMLLLLLLYHCCYYQKNNERFDKYNQSIIIFFHY